MHDIRRIRQNPEELRAAMQKRGKAIDLDAFLELEEMRRVVLAQAEALKARRNAVSAEIPRLKKAGEDVGAWMEEMRGAGDKIKALDEHLRELDGEVELFLLSWPNLPHESVPDGLTDENNLEIRRAGTPRPLDQPQPHWDLGEALGILDFAAAAKVTGARFTFYKGLGARLERAIINYFLDTHTQKSGYTEIFPPFMAHRNSMVGTGQLPKFEEDAFKVQGTDYFLIPTAEVPVTNMFREQTLDASRLPIKYCAYSACFRAEAGSAGRDTRGLIRQHQFNKVELVKFSLPENSYAELETLTADAEKVLDGLGLPYRVVALCAGDLGFASAKTYDIEVWMPSYNRYVEISSCSNFEDFQARRAGIRFRRSVKDKPEFLHTLNGSGVAVGRTVAAILENFQQPDGSIRVPEALVPYMGTDVIRRTPE